MDELPLSDPPVDNRARALLRWIRKLTVSDVSGIATTVVSIVALWVSLHVFSVQESEQKEADKVQGTRFESEAKLEHASNNLLYSVNQLLNGEQVKLQRVADDLDTAHTVLGQLRAHTEDEVGKLQQADAALGDLQAHAEAQVTMLDQADHALNDGLKAANGQLRIDKNINGVTSAQYDLLKQEHKDEVARENAQPKLVFNIEYDTGLKSLTGSPAAIGKHIPIYFPVGPEQSLAFAIQVKNIGNGALQTPTFLIANLNGTVELQGGPHGTCEALNIHVLQCGNSRTLFPNRSYSVPFTITAPKLPTEAILSVRVESEAPRIGSSDPTDTLTLDIIPPVPTAAPAAAPTSSHF